VRLALIANPGSGAAPDPTEFETLLATAGADVACVLIGEIADRDGSIGPAALCAGATRPDDRLLDVAVVPAGSRLGLARRAFGMRTGRLTEQDGVAHERA
jgi:diacylglycerol kinase family enzyme